MLLILTQLFSLVLAGALNADLIQGGIDEDEIVGNLVIDTRHNNSCGNDCDSRCILLFLPNHYYR